jgi:hypothetical protein
MTENPTATVLTEADREDVRFILSEADSGGMPMFKRIAAIESVLTAHVTAAEDRMREAVLDLHHRRPHDSMDFITHGQTEFPDLCDHCRTRWPCKTAAVLAPTAHDAATMPEVGR